MISEANPTRNVEAIWMEEPRRLFDQAPEAILVFDDGLRYLDANPAACELLRRTREEIVGRRVGEFSQQDGERLARRVREANGGMVVEENLTVVLQDGTERCVELVTRPNLLPGIHVSFSRDVTERRQLQRELEHHNRLEAIGKVAGSVAHDFNNMLTAILSYCDLQLARIEDEGPVRRYALGIRAAAERAAETTGQLLAFCRRQQMQLSRLNVNAVVADAAVLVRRLIGEDIALVQDLEPNLPPVLADSGQLHQVLVNLAVNARDAMPRGGELMFCTSRRQADPGRVGDSGEPGLGPYVSILVHDTGSGISSEVLPHIFDPFFTTKAPGKGTGLGLSTVYGIVKQSRGKIFVSSEAGSGTTFEILLPALPPCSEGKIALGAAKLAGPQEQRQNLD